MEDQLIFGELKSPRIMASEYLVSKEDKKSTISETWLLGELGGKYTAQTNKGFGVEMRTGITSRDEGDWITLEGMDFLTAIKTPPPRLLRRSFR